MEVIEYIRVLPRDLFNEAKLLKCLGVLVLQIEDRTAPEGLSYTHNGKPFRVVLLEMGALMVTNLHFWFGEKELTFISTYNSKSNFPFFCFEKDVEYPVFDESGKWDAEFMEFIKTLKA